ncbi:MAG: hypothetical protein RMK92_12170, partial [Armatimonadota bacterium]|nr:hypothetical protein [Armatimonadota bacterium]
ALARGGLSEAQPLLLRLTQPLTMNQYHMLIFTPSAGWQDDMPCLRPPESFRAMMPVLRPQGVLGTNRAVLIPPEVSIVRVR